MQDKGQGKAPSTSGVLKRAFAGLRPTPQSPHRGVPPEDSRSDTLHTGWLERSTHWRRNGRV